MRRQKHEPEPGAIQLGRRRLGLDEVSCESATMVRISLLAAVGSLALSSGVAAKDCMPVETAPGVRVKPAGCADIPRQATPTKADGMAPGSDGTIVSRDGIRIGGRVKSEVGIAR
jgi:hypothetical protein